MPNCERPRQCVKAIFAAGANRRLKFEKCRQLFLRAYNETLSVVAVRVNNPDRSPFVIYRRDTTPTPSCLAEIVRDDLPVLDTPFRGDIDVIFASISDTFINSHFHRIITFHFIARGAARVLLSRSMFRAIFCCQYP